MFKDLRKYVLFIAFIIFTAFQAEAMPPHPGNTNPSGRERPPAPLEGDTPLYQSLMRSSAAGRVSSSAPATGTVRVLVILADFGADVAATPPVGFKDDNMTLYSGRPGFLFLSVLTAILFIFVIKKWKWILPLSAYFIVLSSCPSSGAGIDYGDPLYFNTDKSVYKEILETGTGLTMQKYYLDMSKDKLTLTFDVVGPYRVSKGWQYYGTNDSAGYDLYPGKFVGEAVDMAEQAGVDFSVYDNDADHIADTVIVIHAGSGEEYTGEEDSIWSHNWTLSSAAAYGDGEGSRNYDGVTINNYTLQPEYTKTPGIPTIGVFCHEFGHVLGLPDLYDTSGQTSGVGSWSLMGSGSWGSDDGKDPAPLLAWERDRVGGSDWVTLTDITADKAGQTIEDIEIGKEAFNIELDEGTGQHLLIEKKTAASGTVPFVPASGILITHIHENVINSYIGSNKVNYGDNRVHGVNIVEAGSSYDSAGRSSLWTGSGIIYSKMPFPNSVSSLAYSADSSTKPNANYYTSEALTSKTGDPGVSITAITTSSFSVAFD